MLEITVPEMDLFNEQTNEVYHIVEQTLVLEHSLLSISKWESKWHKSFFKTSKDKDKPQPIDEQVDYIRCMIVNKPKSDKVEYACTSVPALRKLIDDYMKDPMTATTFGNNRKGKTSREIVTSELVYYWMVSYNIPMECEKWHINRLMTLIHVCEAKSSNEKMSKKSIYAQNRELNAMRRAKLHSKG